MFFGKVRVFVVFKLNEMVRCKRNSSLFVPSLLRGLRLFRTSLGRNVTFNAGEDAIFCFYPQTEIQTRPQ
jgi:hypothetical protein